jgi:antitoxin component YwqK of YwqJK toxin-antitoxin module
MADCQNKPRSTVSKPISRVVEKRFADGTLHQIYTLVNTLRDGEFKEWEYPGHILVVHGFYKMGQKHGDWLGWYENGKPAFHYRYNKNLQDGPQEHWDEDTGKLDKLEFYIRGKEEGEQMEWFPDGKVREQCMYHCGKREGTRKVFFPNGARHEESYYENDATEGEKTVWYQNGKMHIHQFYCHGFPHGLCEEWYGDGTLAFEYNSHYGKEHGECKSWYENGQMKAHKYRHYGQPIGESKEWFANGQLQSRATRSEYGLLYGYTEIRRQEDGSLIVRKHYKNDRLDGEYKEWNSYGLLIRRELWRDNEYVVALTPRLVASLLHIKEWFRRNLRRKIATKCADKPYDMPRIPSSLIADYCI